MHGGDLHRALYHRGTGLLSDDAARLCLAELVVGIESMHKQKILHRDLKLENIFIDKEGHLKLADFGLAAQLDTYDSDTDTNSSTSSMDSDEAPKESTKGFCGTPCYIAPEIYQGDHYSYPVDIWTLGIIFYVIRVGSVSTLQRRLETNAEWIHSSLSIVTMTICCVWLPSIATLTSRRDRT